MLTLAPQILDKSSINASPGSQPPLQPVSRFIGVSQSHRPSLAEMVALASGRTHHLGTNAKATVAIASPAVRIPAAPAKATAPPVPAFSPSAEIKRLENLIPLTKCGREKFRMLDHIDAVRAGNTDPFLSRREVNERQTQLQVELNSAGTNNEKWRLAEQIDQLAKGVNPGQFVPATAIKSQVAALTAKLEAEPDSAKRWDLLEHIAALESDQKFVSIEQRSQRRSQLETSFKVATSNNERFRLAREINELS